MKRCPQCKRDYADETLNFCLDDGSELVEGSGSIDTARTAILSVHDTEGPTRTFDTPKSADDSASANSARARVKPWVFIAAAAARTKHIKLGTGVVSLPYHHPLMVADRMVLLDHILPEARTLIDAQHTGYTAGDRPNGPSHYGTDGPRRSVTFARSASGVLWNRT